MPQQLREWYAQRGGSRSSARCPYVIRTGDRAGQTCGTVGHTQSRCFSCLSDTWRAEFGDAGELPRWLELLRQGVDIFALDYDAILTAMYALTIGTEGDCSLCVLRDPGIEAAALGASESALPGTALVEDLHTFTLDSGASRCFFCDSTTLTPLSAHVPVRLADPSGGAVLARSSTVLPCPAVPSGSLSGLHIPSFSTNLMSTTALQDVMVTTITPGGQPVSICTCTRTGRHLATFTRRPGSNLYTLTTEPPQVAASAQVSASRPVAPPCSCHLLSHQNLLWHHRLGHPSLPRLRGMHSRLLVSGLPAVAAMLSPGPPSMGGMGYGRTNPLHKQALLSQRSSDWDSDTSQVSASPPALSHQTLLSCRFLSHQTLLWHHRLGHPSLPCLRGMHSRLLVSGLPRSLPPLPPSPALPCLPCVEGRQRAAPHSSFPPTTAPLQTLHMDVWGPARISGQGRERYFLLVVDDYTRYTMVFPLRCKGEVPDVLIPWIRAVRLQLRERFREDLPVLRLHFDRGGELSSDLLRDFCRGEGILQLFMLPASPQQSGIAERRIGLVMEVARTSMIHAAAPHFLWPFAVWLVMRRCSGSGPFVPLFRDTSADKLSAGAIPCVFLGFPPDAPGWKFYHPTSRRVIPSQDVTFDESVPFTGSAPSGVSQVDPLPGTMPVEVAVGSGAARGTASGGAAFGGAEPGGAESEGAGSGGAEPWGTASSGGPAGASPRRTRLRSGAAGAGVSAAGDTGAGGVGVTAGAGGTGGAAAAGPRSARTRGTGAAVTGTVGGTGPGGAGARDPAKPGGAGAGGTGAGAAGAGGAGAGDTGAVGAGARGTGAGGAGAGGSGAGDIGTVDHGARGAGAGGAVSGGTGAGGNVRPRPYFVPLLQQVLGPPSSTGLTPPLLCAPPDQSQPPLQPASPQPTPSPYTEQTGGLTECREPESHPASPVRAVCTGRRVPRPRPPPVPGTHAMALHPSSVPPRVPLPPPPESSLPASTAASALVAKLIDFVAACRPDYATALVAEFESASPPFFGGECAIGTDILEDRQEDFECLAATVPRFASMLLAPKGDPDAPDIPTSRSYIEAITGPYSSQWQTAMDVEMASWKSTGTYVDAVPPPGANIVSGMWIFRVKRPPGSPPAFKARYVARGFSQRQGVDFFHTFSPTPKMTTLRVLLHVAAQRDYELHSLDFSTAFLQGSLHEEIWLRRPPGFTGSFPAGIQWNLWRQVYGLRQAPRDWHDTLRTTLAALGFTPTTNPSLILRTDTSLPLFHVDDLVFATANTEALTLVKSELQKRHTCTDLGKLRSYLGLQITRDRTRRTITLTQSHMVQQVLQRFGFQFSSPEPTPLSTGHSLSAPPSDELVELSGPYPELVGCLMYLMTCTRPDLAYPLSLLARYVAPDRHRKVHWDAAKRVLCYLCSTSGMVLVLGGRGLVVLSGHAEASWVDDSAAQRSSQGYTFSLGSGSVSWRSTHSSSVLSSSCEAEIYAGAMAVQELCWLTYLVTDLGEQPRSPPVLYVDNKAMIALCQEHRLEHRTKHIALRYFLARELQQCGQLRLAYVATRANTADILTKALPPGDHQRFSTVLVLLALLFLTGLVTAWDAVA
ncbi:unnamed protein product [Closterium sp. NIES-53]